MGISTNLSECGEISTCKEYQIMCKETIKKTAFYAWTPFIMLQKNFPRKVQLQWSVYLPLLNAPRHVSLSLHCIFFCITIFVLVVTSCISFVFSCIHYPLFTHTIAYMLHFSLQSVPCYPWFGEQYIGEAGQETGLSKMDAWIVQNISRARPLF